jgi:curved DNA-binding protein CbpA
MDARSVAAGVPVPAGRNVPGSAWSHPAIDALRDRTYGDGVMRDPYRVLSVARDADRSEIHHAFRVLARELHPDRGGDPALMQQLNEAWAILSRPAYRRAYDDARAAALERRRARQAQRAGAAGGANGGTGASGAPSSPWGTAAPARPPKRERRPDALDYGRYEGWTIRELAREDPDYLLWLARTPAGRMYRTRILEALAEQDERLAAARPLSTATRSRRMR